MKTTARNQFHGVVKSIHSGATNDEVIVDIGGGLEVVAGITQSSTKRLGLEEGKEVLAFVKAPWIILARHSADYEFSTRNLFVGEIVDLKEGAVNSEVFIRVNDEVELVAIIANESVKNLDLFVGENIKALFKAPHVILATKKA